MASCGSAGAQIVAFGASNISGWNVAASDALPAQLQSMLRAKGYGTAKVINAGIYGNTTADMRNRLDTDIPPGTKVVILDASGGLYNDLVKGIGRDQGNADMAAIKTRLEARGISVIPFSATDIAAAYHQPDGLHLTPEGHKLAASQLLPQVTAVLGPPSATASTDVVHACLADARRLCADVLGDDEKRHACMHDHRADLSKDCRDAITRSRQR